MSYFLVLCHKIVLTDKSKLVVKMRKFSKVLVLFFAFSNLSIVWIEAWVMT